MWTSWLAITAAISVQSSLMKSCAETCSLACNVALMTILEGPTAKEICERGLNAVMPLPHQCNVA